MRRWSGTVTRKAHHKIIKTGPYGIVRHPIYSGLSLAILATVLLRPGWFGLIGAAAIIASFVIKYRLEERLLPAASLHLENHHAAAGEALEILELLDDRTALETLRGGQSLDFGFIELVVVIENRGPIGEETQVGLEAVRPGSKRLLE